MWCSGLCSPVRPAPTVQQTLQMESAHYSRLIG